MSSDPGTTGQTIGKLNEASAEEVLGRVAQVSSSQGALASGLRAAARETSNKRVSRALQYVAAEVERGRNLQDALSDSTLRMPAHVQGLITAAARTGQLGPALDELLEHHRALRFMHWSILGSLAYPLVVLSLAILILGLFLAWVVPQFQMMFEEMDLALPGLTMSLIEASNAVSLLFTGRTRWLYFLTLVALVVVVFLAASGKGGARVQRLLENLPIMGPLWAWSGASSFMYLLAALLEQQVPLPEALRLTGLAMRKSDLRHAGIWLAKGVEGGESLSKLIERSNCLPASSVPVLRWGEQTGALSDAARNLSELFAERVSTRTIWLRSASPSVVYLFIVITLGFAVTSLFLPLFNLIQSLV